MKKFLIVLGVVVAVIIAVVIVAFVAKDKFRPDAEKVLADLNAGKEAEVYAGASTPDYDVEAVVARMREL